MGDFIKRKTLYCSFCGKSQHRANKLIAGPTVFICDGCVAICIDLLIKDQCNTEEGSIHLIQGGNETTFDSFEELFQAARMRPPYDVGRIIGAVAEAVRLIPNSPT